MAIANSVESHDDLHVNHKHSSLFAHKDFHVLHLPDHQPSPQVRHRFTGAAVTYLDCFQHFALQELCEL